MEIRKAEGSDAPVLAELEALLFSDAWSKEGISSSLSSPFSLALIALADGKAVGYLLASALAPEGELFRIGVHPEYRRQGIGGRLMERFIAEAKGLTCDLLFLEVRSKNESAISLYRRCGFSDCGLRKKYYHQPEDDALLMKAEI
jgi:ribosomal-protein-alanine N-acetyltransferase